MDFIEYKYPELKENEDEKIRKGIKLLVKMKEKDSIGLEPVYGASYKEMIAWLEKQGEKANPYSGISFEYNGHIWGMCARDNGVDILLDKQLFKHLDEQGEQKSAWSEEDENGLGDALWAVQQARTIAKDENEMGGLWYAEKWLKSLKGRIQPQPKKEWSKEDERIFTLCALSVKTRYNDGLLTHYEYKLASLWLESLKERMKGE